MKSTSDPLVSVVTPVYNGEKYLGDCIESVLAQSYKNWEYIIVNNCSTDGSLSVAEKYAAKDARIKIFSNKQLLPIMKNWNHALRQTSRAGKYCKVVHADDLIFPQCIELMVRVAEDHPSVGIVGSYGLKGKKIVSDRLPFPDESISGRKLCRRALRGRVHPFPRPTALLIRSDLISRNEPFYNESNLQADHEVCYEILRNHDFGFVHQVLTFMRVHDNSVTSSDFDTYAKLYYTNLALLIKYGPVFLSDNEYKKILNRRIQNYYLFLAFSLFSMKNKDFWNYHRSALNDLGYKFTRLRLYAIIFTQFINNPRMTLSKIKSSMLSSRQFDNP
jgi:glycosyltransferase involved in cell wall biosynthesis